MKIGKLLLSIPVYRDKTPPIGAYFEFCRQMMDILSRHSRSITISPAYGGESGGFTLKFMVKSEKDLEVNTLRSTLEFARRMHNLGLEKIIFSSGVRQSDMVDLIKSIIFPFFERELIDFSRPNIEVHFRGGRPAASPPPARPAAAPENPYWGYKIQHLFQTCKKIDAGRLKPPKEDLDQLKKWLKHVLFEDQGMNFEKYYIASQRQWIRDFYNRHFNP